MHQPYKLPAMQRMARVKGIIMPNLKSMLVYLNKIEADYYKPGNTHLAALFFQTYFQKVKCMSSTKGDAPLF